MPSTPSSTLADRLILFRYFNSFFGAKTFEELQAASFKMMNLPRFPRVDMGEIQNDKPNHPRPTRRTTHLQRLATRGRLPHDPKQP
jgi:hypothetical protein